MSDTFAGVTLHLGDCLDVMRTLPENSVDAVVTDPPYALTNRVPDEIRCSGCGWVPGRSFGKGKPGDACSRCGAELTRTRAYKGAGFMGKEWDNGRVAFEPEVWEAALRVAKPGAHLLAFGGTRTHHRLMVAIEDAGWEIRDCLTWLYGQGFPKSHNLGNGWGTALKPAWEPIIMARKPLSEPTIAANVLRWGTGGIHVDACRIDANGARPHIERRNDKTLDGDVYGSGINGSRLLGTFTQGRWPANLILDEEAAALLDEQSGTLTSGKPNGAKRNVNGPFLAHANGVELTGYGDTGGASRFFLRVAQTSRLAYHSKASKRDRDEGLGGTRTVKYNIDKSNILSTGDLSWKDVSTVLVALLQRVTSEQTVTWLIGESGESIMGQCPSDSLSTTLTEISRITTSQILSLLTPSLISDCIAGANYATVNGGSLAASAENLSKCQPTITNENYVLAPGVRLVVSQMLSTISDAANWKLATNIHSTVKPTALMQWLVRLVTPPGGTVLDPFLGSGSTLKAAALEGFNGIGIDTDAEYLAIARRRIEHAQAQHAATRVQLPLLELA